MKIRPKLVTTVAMCVLCMLCAVSIKSQPAAAQTDVPIGFPTAPGQAAPSAGLQERDIPDNVIDLAQMILDEHSPQLDSTEESFVYAQIGRFAVAAESSQDAATQARKASSSAAMLAATAYSDHGAVALAAAAVLRAPDDALVVNNFGAVLRWMGLIDESIVALKHALSLAPYSPAVLANLGNSYVDKDMITDAEFAFRKALTYDPDFEDAHFGMSLIWAKRGNWDMALESLAKAARTGYTPLMRPVFLAAKRAGASVGRRVIDIIIEDSTSESQQDAGSGQQPSDRPSAPRDRLILPTLPRWGSRGALLASAPTYQPLVQQIMERGLIGAFVFAFQYHGDELMFAMGEDPGDWGDSGSDWDDGWEDDWEDDWYDDWGDDWEDDWEDDETDDMDFLGEPTDSAYGEQLFMLELVNDYYASLIDSEMKRVAARRQEIEDRFAREMDDLKGSGMYRNLEKYIMANKVYEAKVLAQQINKLGGQIADTHFYAWRDLTLGSYARLRAILQEYWSMSNHVTSDIYDPLVMDYVNNVRELTVYAALLPLAIDLSTLPQSYALADYIAPITAQGEDLSRFRLQPLGTLEVPKKEPKPCPLGRGLSLGLGPASFTVTCDSWELEFLAGLGAAYRHNFRTGESDISILVGAQARLFEVGRVSAGVEVKGGLRLRFDSNGDFAGWTERGEFNAKTGIGPLSGSQPMTFTDDFLMVAGPRASTTSTLGARW